MPPISFTDQQRLAIETQVASIALNAGAGCGKTFVLANRLLREISPSNGRPLSRITALTFTNKAARELRQRVRLFCRNEWRASEDLATREHWRKLVRELEAAPIGTFHIFCGGLLRRFSVEAGLDPGYTLLEGPLATLHREQAIEAVLREALIDRDPDLIALAVEYGLGSVQSSLATLLDNPTLRDLAGTMPDDSSELVRIWHNAWLNEVRPLLVREILDAGQPLLEILQDCEFAKQPVMRERKSRLFELLASLENDGPTEANLNEIKEHARIQSGGKFESEETKSALKELMQTLRDLIEKKRPMLLVNPDASREMAFTIQRLHRLAQRAHRSVQTQKTAQGMLDFNDLLLATRDLLRSRPDDVRNMLCTELDAILIDEFQDTDPIQEEIVRMIAGPDYAGGRLFVVGDVKQSIYGFRGARPDLFTQLEAEFPEAGRLPLSENFRSMPGVLNFVNALFENAFDHSYQPLLPGIKPPEALAALPSVVFLWDGPPSDEHDKREKSDELRREEGRRIARYLKTQIDDKRPIRDKKTGAVRPMTAGDVAILFRSFSDLPPYERALSDAGLDYHVIGGRAFYAQQEINDVTNLLTVVEDPYHALALAGSLRSPFFGLTDEALYWLAMAGGRNLTEGLKLAAESGLSQLSPTDLQKAKRAWGLLSRWRSYKDREPIGDLISRIFDESGYECALLGESLGDRKRANARKTIDLARQYDAEGNLTLADFATRLRADLSNPPKEAEAATTDEEGDVIRLLTIHQSKGLEFPVVVIPDLNRKDAGGRTNLAIDSELGLVMSGEVAEEDGAESTQNLGWLVHKRLQARREEAEALRVFYVATTRARDLLVLSSASRLGTKPISPALKLLDRRFDLNTGSVRSFLPPGWPDPSVSVVLGTNLPGLERSGSKPSDLLGVAALIESAQVHAQTSATRSELPGLIRLRPEAGLGPRLARVERLVRDTIQDPNAFRPGMLDQALSRAVRRQPEIPSSRLVEEASRRLERIRSGPFARTLADAGEIRTCLPSCSQLLLADGSMITLDGYLDLAYRTSKGLWNILTVSLVEAEASGSERVRSLFAARQAQALGIEPLANAWWLLLGDGGSLRAIDDFDNLAIERALIRLISARQPAHPD